MKQRTEQCTDDYDEVHQAAAVTAAATATVEPQANEGSEAVK